jgi:hypothetical protein
MSENQNPEVNPPTEELDDEQLTEVAGGGGPQQGLLLPYIEQDNIYKATQDSPVSPPSNNISLNYTKVD